MNLLDALSLRKEKQKPDQPILSNFTLEMKYLPYARQDRSCAQGESFALEVFIRAIAGCSQDIAIFSCWDAHSETTTSLIRKFMPHVLFLNSSQATMFSKFEKYDLRVDVVVGPDNGSRIKAMDVANVLGVDGVTLNKFRKDGKVLYEDYEFDTLVGNVLIVDDIGDGMATFIGCGEMLRRTQPRITRLEVYVTHGIFSRGLDHLVGIFDAVCTANLMNPSEEVKNHPLLKIFSFKRLYPHWTPID
jgi:ribose-phosphate pyrophosphokinase